MNKTVSLVVPTCNMSDYIPELWESLIKSNTLDFLEEVVFVNDGSTDSTESVIKNLMKANGKITYVDLKTNHGRFIARYRGAEAARGTHLLFLDTRVTLSESFGLCLKSLLESHDALQGTVHIDVKKSVYNLYWQRSHETLFRRHYRDSRNGFYLTPDNYESYLKGTTVFLCMRQHFLKACDKYKNRPLHSDDTFLMREIVAETPIWVDNRLSIEWEPRQGYFPFLQRLWERGPKFAEYHVLERKGLYFFLFLGWSATVLVTLILIIVSPLCGFTLLGSGLAILALSTLAFARSPVEFVRLVPIHVGTILAYGLGAIYGVGVNFGWFKKPSPTAAIK
jgi:glycosyltransferase involved in cell wall biosynthesis